MTPNHAFERSARQRCCRVPSSLRSSAPAQRDRCAVPSVDPGWSTFFVPSPDLMALRLLVLVKHGFPILDSATPAREWSLSPRGETEALLLAEELRPYKPVHLVSSSEPKARRTAELVAAILRTPNRVVDDLREIDRPALPIMEPTTAHRELNRPILSQPNRAVLGSESANAVKVPGRTRANHPPVSSVAPAAESGARCWRTKQVKRTQRIL
jgi:hypothetical protein